MTDNYPSETTRPNKTDGMTSDITAEVANKNYETAIAELETILTQLEDSQLPLEEAIKQFEAGVKLVKHCQHILNQTEQKIEGLMQGSNEDNNSLESDT